MNRLFKFFIGISLLLVTIQSQAQVSDVTFRVVYDTATCRYNCLMKVIGGSASAVADRIMNAASQYSVIVPTGSVVSDIQGNYPRAGTVTGTGASATVALSPTPAPWFATTVVSNPSGLSGSDIYGFGIAASPTQFFAALSTNDEIVLFSFKTTSNACGAGIRMWKNNIIQGNAVLGGDPGPLFLGGGGGDFNNSFGMGNNSNELYAGNGVSSVTPPSPSITSVAISCAGGNFSLTATVKGGSACASPGLTYAWAGPNSFKDTGTTGHNMITIVSPTAANNGVYSLVVFDSNRCATNFSRNYSATTCTALPIKLTSFIGVADKCMASFVWTTATVAGFKEYEVQYSRDGKNFETVGQVSAAANQSNRYVFEYPQSSGKGYYRLKVIDQTGADSYSETITVVTNCPESAIKIFPNPATSVVHIQGIEAGDEVKIMDALGQVITSAVSPGNIATLDLTPYAPGVYSVMINKGATMTKAGQVVKQ